MLGWRQRHPVTHEGTYPATDYCADQPSYGSPDHSSRGLTLGPAGEQWLPQRPRLPVGQRHP